MVLSSLQKKLNELSPSSIKLGSLGEDSNSRITGTLEVDDMIMPIDGGQDAANWWSFDVNQEVTAPFSKIPKIIPLNEVQAILDVFSMNGESSVAFKRIKFSVGKRSGIGRMDLAFGISVQTDFDLLDQKAILKKGSVISFNFSHSISEKETGSNLTIDNIKGEAILIGKNLKFEAFRRNGIWDFHLFTDGDDQFPVLSDLGQLIGMEDIGTTLNASIKPYGFSISGINSIALGFDGTSKKIQFLAINLIGVFRSTPINLYLSLPDFQIIGSMMNGKTTPLGALISLPKGFPHAQLSNLEISVGAKDKTFAFFGTAEMNWSVIPELVTLLELRPFISISKGVVSGGIKTRLDIANQTLQLEGSYGDSITFTGEFSKFNIASLLNRVLPESLPDSFPLSEINDVKISLDTGTKSFSLSGKSTISWRLSKALIIEEIEVSVNKSPTNLDFALNGKILVSEEEKQLELTVASGSEVAIKILDPIEFTDLASIGSFFGGSLKSLFPSQVSFPGSITVDDIVMKYDLQAKKLSSYSIEIASPGEWEVVKDFLSVSNIEWDINADNLTNPEAKNTHISMGGKVDVLGQELTLTGVKQDTGWDLDGKLVLDAGGKSLKDLVSWFIPDYDQLSMIPALTFNEITFDLTPGNHLAITAKSPDSWSINLGPGQLDCSNLSLGFEREKKGAKWVSNGTFSSDFKIGSTDVDLSVDFLGAFVLDAKVDNLKLGDLIDLLGARQLLADIDFPDSIMSLELNELDFDFDISNKKIVVAAETKFNDVVEIMLCKVKSKWGFAVGFQLSSQFKISNLIPELNQLDSLSFEGGSLMLATFRATQSFQKLNGGEPIDVVPGLTFYTDLSLQGLGADKLLGINELEASATIGTKLSEFQLTSEIEGNMALGEGIEFKDIKFILRPSPANFAIVVQGTIEVEIEGDVLTFVGGFDVAPNGASFFATMPDTWKDPFDAKGLTVKDLSLELGMSFQGLPTVGLAGSVIFASYKPSLAVKFDSMNPAQSLFSFSLNKLYLNELFGTVVDASLSKVIPKDSMKTILDVKFTKLQFYIAPMDTTIGALFYEQGLSIRGNMNMWGLNGKAALLINFSDGIKLDATMDQIRIGKLFRLTGAGSLPNPEIHLEISKTKLPEVFISGQVDLLGIKTSTLVKLSDTTFYFKIEGSLFNIISASVEATGGSLKRGVGFMVTVSLQDRGFFNQIASGAAELVVQAANDLSKEVKKHQEEVADAKRKVNSLNNQINSMRNQIRNERASANRALNNAKNDVASKQRSVNSLQSTINSKQREKIRQGNRKISKRIPAYWKPTPSWSKPWAGHWVYKTISIPDPAGIAMAAKLQAELVGLQTALTSSQGALAIAQTALNAAKGAVNITPIDSDPRIVGLFTAKESATLALNGYNEALKGSRIALGGIATASEFVAKHGLGNLIQIHSAGFSGGLSSVSGGTVRLNFDLSVQGSRKQFALRLNLKNPASVIDALGKKLIKELQP